RQTTWSCRPQLLLSHLRPGPQLFRGNASLTGPAIQTPRRFRRSEKEMYAALALGLCQFEPSEPRHRVQDPGRAEQLHDRECAAPPAADFESTSAVVQSRDRALQA